MTIWVFMKNVGLFMDGLLHINSLWLDNAILVNITPNNGLFDGTQAIMRTNVDNSSFGPCGVHLMKKMYKYHQWTDIFRHYTSPSTFLPC